MSSKNLHDDQTAGSADPASCCCEPSPVGGAHSGCPMSSMCDGMAERMRGFLGVLPVLFGLLLVAAGLLIILHPQLLPWFAAVILVLMGLCLVTCAFGMRRCLHAATSDHGQGGA